MSANECLLSNVVRVVETPHHPKRQIEDAGVIAGNDDAKSLFVSRARGHDKGTFGGQASGLGVGTRGVGSRLLGER